MECSFVLALFGSPYLLNDIPELPSYALANNSYPGAEAAMVRALFGEIPLVGRLPDREDRPPPSAVHAATIRKSRPTIFSERLTG